MNNNFIAQVKIKKRNTNSINEDNSTTRRQNEDIMTLNKSFPQRVRNVAKFGEQETTRNNMNEKRVNIGEIKVTVDMIRVEVGPTKRSKVVRRCEEGESMA